MAHWRSIVFKCLERNIDLDSLLIESIDIDDRDINYNVMPISNRDGSREVKRRKIETSEVILQLNSQSLNGFEDPDWIVDCLSTQAWKLGLIPEFYASRKLGEWVKKNYVKPENIACIIGRVHQHLQFIPKQFLAASFENINADSKDGILVQLHNIIRCIPNILSLSTVCKYIYEESGWEWIRKTFRIMSGQRERWTILDDYLISMVNLIFGEILPLKIEERERFFFELIREDYENMICWNSEQSFRRSLYGRILALISNERNNAIKIDRVTFMTREMERVCEVQENFLRVSEIAQGLPQEDLISQLIKASETVRSGDSKAFFEREQIFIKFIEFFDARLATSGPISVKNNYIGAQSHSVLEFIKSTFDREHIHFCNLFGLFRTFCRKSRYPRFSELTINSLLSRSLASCQQSSDIVFALQLALIACKDGSIQGGFEAWLKSRIVSEETGIIRTKRQAQFFFGALSAITPHESAEILRIYARISSDISPNWKDIASDYVSLAKTRILDIARTNTAHHSNDVSIFSYDKPRASTLIDLAKILSIFAQTHKIPKCLAEAIIFRNKWYFHSFLPTLLRSPVSPGIAQNANLSNEECEEARSKLIKMLDECGKIPAGMLLEYQMSIDQSKKGEKEEKITDMDEGRRMALGELTRRLEDLVELAKETGNSDGIDQKMAIAFERIEEALNAIIRASSVKKNTLFVPDTSAGKQYELMAPNIVLDLLQNELLMLTEPDVGLFVAVEALLNTIHSLLHTPPARSNLAGIMHTKESICNGEETLFEPTIGDILVKMLMECIALYTQLHDALYVRLSHLIYAQTNSLTPDLMKTIARILTEIGRMQDEFQRVPCHCWTTDKANLEEEKIMVSGLDAILGKGWRDGVCCSWGKTWVLVGCWVVLFGIGYYDNLRKNEIALDELDYDTASPYNGIIPTELLQCLCYLSGCISDVESNGDEFSMKKRLNDVAKLAPKLCITSMLTPEMYWLVAHESITPSLTHVAKRKESILRVLQSQLSDSSPHTLISSFICQAVHVQLICTRRRYSTPLASVISSRLMRMEGPSKSERDFSLLFSVIRDTSYWNSISYHEPWLQNLFVKEFQSHCTGRPGSGAERRESGDIDLHLSLDRCEFTLAFLNVIIPHIPPSWLFLGDSVLPQQNEGIFRRMARFCAEYFEDLGSVNLWGDYVVRGAVAVMKKGLRDECLLQDFLYKLPNLFSYLTDDDVQVRFFGEEGEKVNMCCTTHKRSLPEVIRDVQRFGYIVICEDIVKLEPELRNIVSTFSGNEHLLTHQLVTRLSSKVNKIYREQKDPKMHWKPLLSSLLESLAHIDSMPLHTTLLTKCLERVYHENSIEGLSTRKGDEGVMPKGKGAFTIRMLVDTVRASLKFLSSPATFFAYLGMGLLRRYPQLADAFTADTSPADMTKIERPNQKSGQWLIVLYLTIVGSDKIFLKNVVEAGSKETRRIVIRAIINCYAHILAIIDGDKQSFDQEEEDAATLRLLATISQLAKQLLRKLIEDENYLGLGDGLSLLQIDMLKKYDAEVFTIVNV
ncbi:uncharacterized protein VTP21DRAFT_5073 [Calcarisporiella thermophila]|uniref:uncharacterized protein n=1 Tax=Calcarisporiella thermophila TaxID=911321 RepID=UPI00374374D9